MELELNQAEKNRLLQNIASYQQLIEILLEYKDTKGICRVTQTELGQKTGVSPTCISKKLKKLQMVDNCIQKVGSGGAYIVNHSDLLTKGPFVRVITFYNLIMVNPEITMLPYKEQADYLHFTLYEVKMVWGYLHSAFGSYKFAGS